jgi:hypothetical protein
LLDACHRTGKIPISAVEYLVLVQDDGVLQPVLPDVVGKFFQFFPAEWWEKLANRMNCVSLHGRHLQGYTEIVATATAAVQTG